MTFLGDRILVEVITETIRPSGIIMPVKSKKVKGKIIAVGVGVKALKEGQIIGFPEHTGEPFEEFLILREARDSIIVY